MDTTVSKSPPDASLVMRITSSEALQTELAYWLDKLKRLDRVLETPALSLIRLGEWFVDPGKAKQLPPTQPPVDHPPDPLPNMLPSWISEKSTFDHRSLLLHSLGCSTLQRLWRTRRRYPWLTKDARKALEALQPVIARQAESLAESKDLSGSLSDPVFLHLNPFVAAEVYWVLLHAGENRVVGGTGFLSIFSMLWALFATHPPDTGYALGDTRTLAASVTAKCLRPILQVQTMFRRRAALYRRIRKTWQEMQSLSDAVTPNKRWRFACAVDRLSGLMLEMSALAINRKAFEKAAEQLSLLVEGMQPKYKAVPMDVIEQKLFDTIAGIRIENVTTVKNAGTVLDRIEREVLPAIKKGDRALRTHLRPARPDELERDYWDRMQTAAESALKKCRKGLAEIANAVIACEAVSPPDPADPTALLRQRAGYDGHKVVTLPPSDEKALEWTLARLADANEKLADLIEDAIRPSTHWCRFVVRQEVAYASAGNDTEFDPAELLSAVAVCERSGYISELEVEDAIAKALRGLHEDGSWSAGQPIYLTKRVLGVWPTTADLAWLLSGAVIGKPKIRRADDALMSFIDWLERTQTRFYRHLKHDPSDDDEVALLAGWSAETRESKTIDLWVTAVAISALLEIRELIEHRLWEMCEKRFFVFAPKDLKTLDDIDPVDLGARHEHRLHHRLRKTARATSARDYRDASYSFVLHGPPGSSKTAMAEALGNEIWREMRGEPRVIRITPADFTRQGEAGLDAEARFVFELLSHIRGATIIFDEIDDLLRRRELKGVPAFLKMVVPAMLNRLQDLRDAAPRQELCYVIAMNYVDNVEPALIRPGRIDAAVPVVYPDPWSRDNTLERVLAGTPAEAYFDERLRMHVVMQTAGWPWPIYNRLCQRAAEAFPDGGGSNPQFQTKRDAVDRLIEQMATQKQDIDSHYAQADRWKPPSPELMNEVAHLAFAYGEEDSRRKVKEMLKGVPQKVVTSTLEKLKTEEAREGRQAYNAALRMRNVGATTLTDDEGPTTVFRVWVPGGNDMTVALQLPSQTAPIPMTRETDDGLWSAEARVGVGDSYRYLIGPEKLEALDPYGREATGEWTVVAEPKKAATTAFKCEKWQQLVVYQVHPETFTREGDYEGVRGRLAALQELGVNAIDLIGASEAVTGPEPALEGRKAVRTFAKYGGTAALRELVGTAHNLNIAVFAGVTNQDLLGLPVADLSALAGYRGAASDFANPHVHELLLENLRRWVEEIGVDGIRWAEANKAPRTVVQEVAEFTRKLGHDTILIANYPHGMKLPPNGIDWNADFASAVRETISPRPRQGALAQLKEAVTARDFTDVYHHLVFAESHETARFGRLRDRLGVGVSAEEARQRAFLATTLTLVAPGIPLIVQGQESLHELALDGSQVLEWDAQAGTFRRLQRLISLRRNVERTTRGLVGHRRYVSPQGRLMVIERWDEKEQIKFGHVVVVLNFDTAPAQPSVRFPFGGEWHVRYNSAAKIDYDAEFGVVSCGPILHPNDNREATVPVAGLGAVILSQDPGNA